MKKIVRIASIAVIALFVLIIIGVVAATNSNTSPRGSLPETEKPTTQTTLASDLAPPAVDQAAQKLAQEEAEVNKKLKARAARDWPDDYSTQEYWVNENIEAYRYMKTIPDNSTKKKAQRDWPLDFSTQKYWYDEQMEAKDRLGK